MALTAVAYSARFDITTKTIIITDNTNYAGAGVDPADVVGVLSVTDPSNTNFYDNTDYNAPDISPSVSLVNSTTISIPQPTSTTFLLGDYVIVYTVQIDNGVDPIYYVTGSLTVDFNYCSPSVNITQTIDCVTPLFTSTDNTTYTVNGITPTKTLEHSLYFPPGSSLYTSPIVGTAVTISTQTFFTGPQTSVIQATLSYEFPDGLIVTDVLTGQKTVIVDCNGVCSVYCCMKSLETRRASYQLKGNFKKAEEITTTLNLCMSLMSLASFSLQCGEQADAQGYLDKILALGNCTGDCGCGSDGTPTQVVGLTTTGDSALPWTLVEGITIGDAIFGASGALTIDSIVTAYYKYKKNGTTVTLSFFLSAVITRSASTPCKIYMKVPTSLQMTNSPFAAHGSSWIINVSDNPDTEMPLPGLVGAILSSTQTFRTGAIDVSVMPVATNGYNLFGTITYETTN